MKLMKFFVSVLLSTNGIGFAAELPQELSQKISTSYPNSKTLVSTSCTLGNSTTNSYGILIQKGGEWQNPLEAVIVYKKGIQLKLFTVPKRVEYSKGSMADFLADYWTTKGFAQGFEIHCTNPKTDKNIKLEANGRFTGKFAAKLGPSAKHLCFSADPTYNSWNCYTLNPANSMPESSFVQMNAD